MGLPIPIAEALLSLQELGMDEVEPGCVADTHENRVRLRAAGHYWTIVDDREETPGPGDVPLIRILSSAELAENAADMRRRKAEILVDPDDAWSDYISPLDLHRDSPAPFWVKMSGIKWRRAEQEGKEPETRASYWLPVRCTAIKADGTRCWLWAGASSKQRDTGMCRVHLNQTGIHREQYIESARLKLAQAAPMAADTIESLAMAAEQESVRLKAATEILDRTGVRAGYEITSETTVVQINASETVRERLDKLREARRTRISGAPGDIAGEIES